ncbi:hypothetical protein HH214_20140 [Mucilaginibacter robiniae]|uniref:Uncharacterized protein n=1 Tax=Mucilaginibacter robiniae TaxID=2728022 RepID=A0A7L5E4P9_9SPHI|nr:hypothetical protein [Mucilaginibacter robiniae]QJD98021.1 hypothetical protein HH214_20140 [Mucilaginibacter robiniae]
MAKFIELLDKNNRNTLINLDHIISLVIYMTPEEEVRVYLTGDNESYITVTESYEQLRNRLSQVSEIIDMK